MNTAAELETLGATEVIDVTSEDVVERIKAITRKHSPELTSHRAQCPLLASYSETPSRVRVNLWLTRCAQN